MAPVVASAIEPRFVSASFLYAKHPHAFTRIARECGPIRLDSVRFAPELVRFDPDSVRRFITVGAIRPVRRRRRSGVGSRWISGELRSVPIRPAHADRQVAGSNGIVDCRTRAGDNPWPSCRFCLKYLKIGEPVGIRSHELLIRIQESISHWVAAPQRYVLCLRELAGPRSRSRMMLLCRSTRVTHE